jgi:hypothetical protein
MDYESTALPLSYEPQVSPRFTSRTAYPVFRSGFFSCPAIYSIPVRVSTEIPCR